VQLIAQAKDNTPLDPEHVVYGTVDANFIDPAGDEIEHDALVDVTITISTPAGTASKAKT
jgi:hypothetical protein